LRHYVTLERLYMPEEKVAIDGRLRENLETVPDSRWLSLFNIRFVVTDKVRDAWFDGVFYDLKMGANLGAGDEAAVGYVPALKATALGIVYQADGAPEGTLLVEVDVMFADGRQVSLPLLADGIENGDRVARLVWEPANRPTAVKVRGAWGVGVVAIRGLSLIDERTGAFQSLVLSDQGHYRLVHSGDVKIYENLDVLPRAFFVPQAILAPDNEAALSVMRDPSFDPAMIVVLMRGVSSNQESGIRHQTSGVTSHVELVRYEPEHIIAAVSAPTDGWLLLNDAWYPGWEARVDGQTTPVERANVLFRALAVPAGDHQVEWLYRPTSFRMGMVFSGGATIFGLIGFVWAVASRKLGRQRS
jgi:hypothetical protein